MTAGCQLAELAYLKDFVQEESFGNTELCWNQLRCLWTAYCFHSKYTPDTNSYDHDLRELWCAMPEEIRNAPNGFENFDKFMGRYLA